MTIYNRVQNLGPADRSTGQHQLLVFQQPACNPVVYQYSADTHQASEVFYWTHTRPDFYPPFSAFYKV